MSNLAFYVPIISKNIVNDKIFACLNKGLESAVLTDASLFFDDVDKNNTPAKFGCFNSTELWNFTGILVASTAKCFLTAEKVVNNFKMLYLYTGEEFSLDLVKISNVCKVICFDEASVKKFKRILNKEAIIISDDSMAKDIIGVANA